MSFIDTYIKKHRIGNIGLKSRKNLEKIEKELNDITQRSKNGLSFLDAIKDHGGAIGDLIERVQQRFNKGKPGFFSNLKFIYSIAIEVYQIIIAMNNQIVPNGVTGDTALQITRAFGQKMVYFIWKTIDPCKKYNWIPFKKTIEKKLVLWLAGMGLDAARDLFDANKEGLSFSANSISVSTRAL